MLLEIRDSAVPVRAHFARQVLDVAGQHVADPLASEQASRPLRWLTPGEAEKILTHEHDRDLLQRFVRGPVLTGCVLLVRHAVAGNRSDWDGDDKERPLAETGWAQAEELVRLLSRFEVQHIVSADFVRSVQTVQPLADALGLPIKEEELFSELGYPGQEHETLNRLRDMGASLDTTVVCSQGGVIRAWSSFSRWRITSI